MPYLLVALGVVARLVPHPWNFTPIGAIGLFSGANCRLSTALIVPMAALLIGDIVVGFYEPVTMAFVYLGFVAAPLIGRLLLKARRSVVRLGGAVWSSATIFFLISNFGVWLAFYPQTAAGLVDCYVRGIPFYGAALLGDSLYVAILFGAQALLSRERDEEFALR